MLTRCVITLGAKTTAGGEVVSGNHFDTINGAPVALERDKCWCPKCNSEGVIMLDGPRLSETVDGREVALSDDLCICKCNPPPRLVAAQDFVYQIIDVEWNAAAVAETVASVEADTTISQSASAATTEELPLLLLHPETQEPYKHRPYKLQLKDKVIEGTTDEQGATRPLSAAERASVLTWRISDEVAPT